MESLDLQPTLVNAEQPQAYDQLVAEGLVYAINGKPVYAATPVGMARDPHIRAVFERNFGFERQERVQRYVGDTAPEPAVELIYNTLSHVDHRRGVHNAGSYELRRREKVPPHLLGLAHYVHLGGATPAGSLRYADEMGMPSIELTKVTLSGTAWQAARSEAARGMMAFSGVPGEWQPTGTIDKGPKMGIAAYGENGEILAVTVRARKNHGTTNGRWQVREMQSYIVRVDADSGINPEITQALQLFARPERTLAFTQALVRQISVAADRGDVVGLKKAAHVVLGNGSEAAIGRVVEAAATVRAFVQTVHGEIERDTLELRDWAIAVSQTIYAHDLHAQKLSDIGPGTFEPTSTAGRLSLEQMQEIVRETDRRVAEETTQHYAQHYFGRLALVDSGLEADVDAEGGEEPDEGGHHEHGVFDLTVDSEVLVA